MFYNLLLLAFLIFMAYWWSLQGLYSGMLHLFLTLIAGALAFTFWEPIVLGFLVKVMPPFAWGIGLVAPFFIYLLCARVFLDRFAHRDVQVFPLADYIGGGAAGLLAGYVSAGILTLGLGFLPLGPGILDFQPYNIDSNGQVVDNPQGTLWFKADVHTAGFYDYLSAGSLSSSTPMHRYQPELAMQASLHRMGFDPGASVLAAPGSIEITAAQACPSPVNYIDDRVTDALSKIPGGQDIRLQGFKLVAVHTSWKAEPRGTYDGDQALRVYSTQIRLISTPDKTDDPPATVHAPLGYTKEDTQSPTKERIFASFKDDKTAIFSSTKTTLLTWFFLIPADHKVGHMLIRHSRFDLPSDVPDDKPALALAAGHLAGSLPIPAEETPTPTADAAKTPPKTEDNPGLRIGRSAGTIAETIAISDLVPLPFSKNFAAGFTINENRLVAGRGEIPAGEGGVPMALAVQKIELPSHSVAVRAKVGREKALSLMGAAVSTAAALNPVYLQDAADEKYMVIAYILVRGDRRQLVFMDLDNPLKSSKELPVREMKGEDALYLYFAVPKGTKLTEFHIGQKTFQQFDLTIPK